MNTIYIDGLKVRSEADFHREFKNNDLVPDFYGKNLNALRDALNGLISKPFCLVWENSEFSRIHMGSDFDRLVNFIMEEEKVSNLSGRGGFVLKLT